MRRGRYPYPMYPPYPYKKKSGAIWVALVVLIIVAIFFANSKGIIHLNLPSLNLGGQSVAQTCVQSVQTCGGVIKSKYGTTVTILNSSEVQSGIQANKYLKVWGSSQSTDIAYYQVKTYPIGLVATRFDKSDGTKTPYVFVCNSTGSLESKSSDGLC